MVDFDWTVQISRNWQMSYKVVLNFFIKKREERKEERREGFSIVNTHFLFPPCECETSTGRASDPAVIARKRAFSFYKQRDNLDVALGSD
jgi:hypothetical protein